MSFALWEAIIGGVGAAGSGAAGAFFTRRSRAERDASSAVMLTKAYGQLVDDQREGLRDARAHIHRQDGELSSLRIELATVKGARDDELNALRQELATVREENRQLRERVAQLERRDLPTTA